MLSGNNIDLLLVEYFNNIEEMEWAIELALTYNKPVAATMCMGPNGDGRVSFLASSGLFIMYFRKLLLENVLSEWRGQEQK